MKANNAAPEKKSRHGNLKPSQADIDLTRKLKTAGTYLDLPVLDHLIITDTGFFSFTDEGML